MDYQHSYLWWYAGRGRGGAEKEPGGGASLPLAVLDQVFSEGDDALEYLAPTEREATMDRRPNSMTEPQSCAVLAHVRTHA